MVRRRLGGEERGRELRVWRRGREGVAGEKI